METNIRTWARLFKKNLKSSPEHMNRNRMPVKPITVNSGSPTGSSSPVEKVRTSESPTKDPKIKLHDSNAPGTNTVYHISKEYTVSYGIVLE